MATRIQQIAEWAHSLKYEDIPAPVLERARCQLLNIVAAAHAGAVSPPSRKLLKALKRTDGGGEAPVVATGDNLSLQSALFANTAFSMAHDYDDYLFFGHTGHSAVFASLLVAASEGRDMRDALTAQVIGNEIGGRLGASVLLGPHNGQMWTHIHAVETAAIAARLMGLDTGGMANAMAIALYQPNYALAPGFMGPDTKLLSAAQTSEAGLRAAVLAREGFTGALDIIENPRGFLSQFSYAPMEFMLSGWGKSWVTLSLAYKLVPGCAYIGTTVDALVAILEKFRARNGRDLEPGEVREITVRSSLLTVGMNAMSEQSAGRNPLNPIAVNFNIPVNIAIVLLAGGLGVNNLDPEWLELHREDILSVRRRVKLEHDWEMSVGVMEAVDEVLNLGRVVDAVGLAGLVRARKRAAEHFGEQISLGLKDWIEMRKRAGSRGKQLFGRMAAGAYKRMLGAGTSRNKRPPDLGECDFSRLKMPFAAEVTLKTADSKEYCERREIPGGAPGRPWDDTARGVREKFEVEAARHLSKEKIGALLERADSLEDTWDAAGLLRNLSAGKEPGAGAIKGRAKRPGSKGAGEKAPRKEFRQYRLSEKEGSDLPPVTVRPLSGREKPASPGTSVKREKPKKPKSVAGGKGRRASSGKKEGAPHVTLRRAAPRSKPPKPPKGAKRRRKVVP